MKQRRETTYEERTQIVGDCISNGKHYGAMALKYQISYQQVRSWANQGWKFGVATASRIRCPALNWNKPKLNSSSTGCIWQKWRIHC